jgi:hypothetical protein
MRSPRPLVTATIILLAVAGLAPGGGAAGSTGEAARPATHGAQVTHVVSAPVGP